MVQPPRTAATQHFYHSSESPSPNLYSVQARAIVPQEFPLGGAAQRQLHEQLDRVWEPAVRMRIVGGKDDIVVAEPFHEVFDRVLLWFDRNEAVALEEFRGLL